MEVEVEWLRVFNTVVHCFESICAPKPWKVSMLNSDDNETGRTTGELGHRAYRYTSKWAHYIEFPASPHLLHRTSSIGYFFVKCSASSPSRTISCTFCHSSCSSYISKSQGWTNKERSSACLPMRRALRWRLLIQVHIKPTVALLHILEPWRGTLVGPGSVCWRTVLSAMMSMCEATLSVMGCWTPPLRIGFRHMYSGRAVRKVRGPVLVYVEEQSHDEEILSKLYCWTLLFMELHIYIYAP